MIAAMPAACGSNGVWRTLLKGNTMRFITHHTIKPYTTPVTTRWRRNTPTIRNAPKRMSAQ